MEQGGYTSVLKGGGKGRGKGRELGQLQFSEESENVNTLLLKSRAEQFVKNNQIIFLANSKAMGGSQYRFVTKTSCKANTISPDGRITGL